MEQQQGIYLYVAEVVVFGQHDVGWSASPAPEPTDARNVFTSPAPRTSSSYYMHELQPSTPETLRHHNAPSADVIPDEPEKAMMPTAVQASYDYRAKTTFIGTIAVIIGAFGGIGLGLLLSSWRISLEAVLWVSLPGNLYIRALRCLIVPMVFCTISTSIAEIVLLKKKSILSLRTAGTFFLTSFLSTVLGMVIALAFHSRFIVYWPDDGDVSSPIVALRCANGLFLGAQSNGTDAGVACTAANATVASAHFIASDVNHALATRVTAQAVTLTDQVVGIISLMVPDNIFEALADGSLLSIIMFALPLGVAIARSHAGEVETNVLLNILRQMRHAFSLMISAVLQTTPFAVVSLIAGAISTYNTSGSTIVSQAGFLILAFVTGVVSHTLLLMPFLFFLFTRANPYNYMKQLVPAYMYAFGCSSSMATLPVAVAVVHQTGQVSRSMAQLVMYLGTPVHMNAAGVYYPLMTIFLAAMSGANEKIGTPQLVVLFFVSLIGSMGTAPVPNAAIVMLMTVWKTVLPTTPLPLSFVYIVACDFVFDRLSTMTNVHGNMFVTRILAQRYDDPVEAWSDETSEDARTPVPGV
ncbi:hypothetical protein SPRG_16221 [Saprolegnia parasitica CBS 223.65]|uniref:Amino acid transporter n=1 Tax=Saprolegnia parasitica (strain CBS 223.65) TaxID=695850 RepID=A0A067BJ38_SAPPC|nr:hypothetical protein SPRG_16221 [Saprolegnia parasitica CBS 223.65]KDO18444.1 hypothetical protein SPRG_16221 [Saprolegnia parasitica CBS 223.65]|eukprot:XP_012210846.1 hypothetical protein SPRG_16221 [Saprolegnia parasitica CBS 223.65]